MADSPRRGNEIDFDLFEHIDTQLGLHRTQGKAELYIKLLQKFVSGQQDFSTLFSESIEANDIVTSTRLVHTLKSVAGAIGALKLAEYAEQLEQDIESLKQSLIDITTSDNYELLEDELSLVCKEINSQLVDGAKEQTLVAFDADKASAVLATLIDMLSDFDMAATELITTERAALSAKPFASLLKQLEKQLDDYEFDEALKVAVQMQAIAAASVTDN